MASNLAVESPDFDQIRKESGLITSNAVKLLWEVLNYEIAQRRTGVREATNRLQGRATADAPTAAEDNLDTEGSMLWWYNTSSSVNLTGLRHGVEGRIVFFHNIGSGTITFKHQNAGSAAENRIVTNDAGDLTLATNESAILMYVNSRWREWAAG